MDHPREFPGDTVVEAILKDSESARMAIGGLQARHHDLGQSRYTGWSGKFETREMHYDVPHPALKDAHRLWALAHEALQRAEHVILMAQLGGEPAECPGGLQ